MWIVHIFSDEVKDDQLLHKIYSYLVSKKYSDKANERRKLLKENFDERTDNTHSFPDPSGKCVYSHICCIKVCFQCESLFMMQQVQYDHSTCDG